MTVIELPAQQAAVLRVKAAARGLSLEAWLKKLAEQEMPSSTLSRDEAVALLRGIQSCSKPDPEGLTSRDYINYGRR